MSIYQRALVCWLTGAAAWSAESLKIGNVDDKLSSSGGCSLQLPSQFARREGNYIFVSDPNSALMNVNGADVHLRLVDPQENVRKHDAKLGDRSTLRYSAPGMDVRIDYTLTENCANGNDPCPVTRYEAVLSIRRGKASKTVAAKAVCTN